MFSFSWQTSRVIQIFVGLFCLLQAQSRYVHSGILEWLCFCIVHLTVHLKSSKTISMKTAQRTEECKLTTAYNQSSSYKSAFLSTHSSNFPNQTNIIWWFQASSTLFRSLELLQIYTNEPRWIGLIKATDMQNEILVPLKSMGNCHPIT